MIPLRDVIPSRTTPFVTVTIIILNAIVFLYQETLPDPIQKQFVLTFALIPADSRIPMVGASGAIAGVLGAYLIMFPQSRVLTLIPLFIIWEIVEIPAVIVLGIWFVLQLLSGVGSLASTDTGGGVAFWAHIAGFVCGMALVPFFKRAERQRVDWWSGPRQA